MCSRLLPSPPPGPREGRDRHRPPPAPEPDRHLQRGRSAEALEALRRAVIGRRSPRPGPASDPSGAASVPQTDGPLKVLRSSLVSSSVRDGTPSKCQRNLILTPICPISFSCRKNKRGSALGSAEGEESALETEFCLRKLHLLFFCKYVFLFAFCYFGAVLFVGFSFRIVFSDIVKHFFHIE